MNKRYFVFAMSLFINAFGNALMFKGGVGASAWTACFNNVSVFFHISAGTASSLVFIILYSISKLIGKDFSFKRAFVFLMLSAFYGVVCDSILWVIGAEQLTSTFLNCVLAVCGACALALSISLSIKANVIFLALDDFLRNTKEHIFNGNIKKASLFSNCLALSSAIIIGLIIGHIYNVTILTFIITFVFGYIVNFFDNAIVINFKDKQNEILECEQTN